jgi:hypothetical protein
MLVVYMRKKAVAEAALNYSGVQSYPTFSADKLQV